MATKQKKKFFIIDGFGFFFKAFFAIPHLTGPGGVPTGAIYGFSNMIKKVLVSEKPDYIAVATDMEGKTFRHDTYEQYKANRPELPEDLGVQIPYIPKICEAFNLTLIGVAGFEADDVIGTLCHQISDEDIEIVIVSSDKDMFQLVNDRVSMMDIRKNNEVAIYTPKTGEEKFGVRPDQMVDKLSLTGDASDNVPGAPGIGEKGAVKLLAEFDSLDELLKDPQKVKGKRYQTALSEHKEQILLSKELVTIKTDLKFPFNLEDCKVKGVDPEKATALFSQFNFKSLLKELGLKEEGNGGGEISFKELNWIFYKSNTLPTFKSEKKLCFFPIYGPPENIGGANHCKALLIHNETKNDVHCIKVEHPDFSNWLKTFLTENKATLFLYNVKDFERSLLEFFPGISFAPQLKNIYDLFLLSFLREPNQRDFTFKSLAQQTLQIELSSQEKVAEEFLSQLSQFKENQSPNSLQKIALEGLEKTIQTYWLIAKEFEDTASNLLKVYHDIELPVSFVLAKIENRGIYCDREHLEKLGVEFSKILSEASEEIYKMAGENFNINSPKQLGQILFEKLGLPIIKKTKKGDWSTNEEVLRKLSEEHKLPEKILHYRHFSKLNSTYVEALPHLINEKTHRIHSTFNQIGASTGRISSIDPNLQNIPIRTSEGQKIRAAFVAEDKNVLLAADYSQIELRVFAHLSEDPVLCDAFIRNEDIHERTAREIFGNYLEFEKQEMRRRAKTINFGVIYGQSPYGLANQLGIHQKEAKAFIENYFERYQGVKKWLDKAVEEATKKGYTTTLFGRIRPIPELKSSRKNIKAIGERTAINTPVQGTAADLIKMAMIKVEEVITREKLKAQMILTVHDELIFEVNPKEVKALEALVRKEMEQVYQFKVPLVVNIETGKSWADAK